MHCNGKTCFQDLIVNQEGSEPVVAPGTEWFTAFRMTKNTPYVCLWVNSTNAVLEYEIFKTFALSNSRHIVLATMWPFVFVCHTAGRNKMDFLGLNPSPAVYHLCVLGQVT